MGTLPSGSREDIELVRVETADLSLIIKGKPYHQQYESLKQYRAMDFHDTMNFDIEGEDIEEIKVYDVDKNQLVEDMNLRPIFFENEIYQLVVLSKRQEQLTFYHEHPSIRKAVSLEEIGGQKFLMGNLQFQNEVGLTTFIIYRGSGKLLEVTLEIFPSKLDYRNDYLKLLEKVNDEIYNLAFHFIRKTYHSAKVKLEGKPSRTEFYRLIEHHFEQLIQAITNIEKQPNHLLRTVHVHARGDQIGKLDSKGRSYLRKRPHLLIEVDRGIQFGSRKLMPVSGLRIKKELTYDTLENRYIKWMMKRVIDKLEDLLRAIQVQMNNKFAGEDVETLTKKISRMIGQLERRLEQPFWQKIGGLDRSVMSLVLQMAPNYRDAFRIFLIISRGLALHGKVYKMSVKDVATLYEYWTFLKLGQILGKHYDLVGQEIVKVNRSGLFVILDTSQTAKKVFQHPVTKEKIILTYQKYAKTPTVAQIPDSVLSIEKKGKDYQYHFIFDAKYRIDYGNGKTVPGPLEEDINTMHRYRDAIVAKNGGPYERTSFGAYVLFPWSDEQSYQHHPFYQSIDKVNIGGLPFLPNATELVENFVRRLIDKNPEEIQQEGILPKGTIDELRAELKDIVLVGLVESKEAYQQFLIDGYYSRPIKKLKNGWQKVDYVALYVKRGISDIHGVYWYGKVINIEIGDKNVKFQVDKWKNLKKSIKSVHYGITNYMLTTLDLLKNSRELPELLMKSEEELAVWRLLRRVSDQVKLELDSNQVDDAKRITEYRIKDLQIKMLPEIDKLLFITPKENLLISNVELLSKPSYVFRELVKMLMRGK